MSHPITVDIHAAIVHEVSGDRPPAPEFGLFRVEEWRDALDRWHVVVGTEDDDFPTAGFIGFPIITHGEDGWREFNTRIVQMYPREPWLRELALAGLIYLHSVRVPGTLRAMRRATDSDAITALEFIEI